VFAAPSTSEESQQQRNFLVSQQQQSQEGQIVPVAPAGFEFKREGETIPIFLREVQPAVEDGIQLPPQVTAPASQPGVLVQPLEPRQGSQEQDRFLQVDNRRAFVISESRSEPTADGRSSFAYETSNGIKEQKETFLDEDGFNVIRGSYSYIDANGNEVSVSYIADRYGFRTTASG
jgi:hypothetical protein